MKKLLLTLSLVLSFSALAEEVPVPSRVVMFNNPTLNGLPFAAVFAHDYETSATVGGVDLTTMSANSAHLICIFMGYERAYTYALSKVPTAAATVLYVDRNLVANPVETHWIDENGKYATTVFRQLGCLKKSY